MEKKKKRNGFASGIGFVLAAAGSAVGLGNLWGFPYKTSANGGAAFVFVYIACVLLIGAVAMIAEIYLGKRAQANTVSSFKKANKNIGFLGLLVLIVPFVIICYYSVLGGWTVKYTINSFQPVEQATNNNIFGKFVSNPFEPIFFTLIFMSLAAIIIMAGVKGGIEKASKILMPTLFAILVFIVIYCLCLGNGVSEGLNYYLNPKFDELGFNGILAAMGQAFFSLSLGMGAMICYGSYTGKEIKLGKSTAMICVCDTLVALLAGLAIFPALGALQPESLIPDVNGKLNISGPSLMYVVLPQVFAKMGDFGQVISFLFFGMVVVAAITSVMSLMEVCAQFVIQKFKVQRRKATLIICGICFAISLPIAWSVGGAFNGAITIFGFDLLTFFDETTNNVLMPLGALAACLAIGWFIEKGSFKKRLNPMNTFRALEEDGLQLGKFGKIFAVMVKFVTPLLILFVEVMGIISQYNTYQADGLNFLYVVAFGLLLIAIACAVYFIFFKKTDTGCNADEIDIAIAASIDKAEDEDDEE